MSAALESLGREVGRLRAELDRLRSIELATEAEEHVTSELHVALEAFLPEAVKHELSRAALSAWLGEPDEVTLGSKDPELVERLCRGVAAPALPPPAEVDVFQLYMGEIMGGSTYLYLFIRAGDGALKATNLHTAYPE